MKIKRYTVILTFPNIANLTGIALVHATNTLGAEAYAVALYPEAINGTAKIVAVLPGWHYPERSPNSPGLAIRSYPVPLSGAHNPLPAADRAPIATKGGDPK